MTINEIREKYLKFFESKGHTVIPPAPLVLQNDPTTLFTSSGMQPLVPYLMGEPHPEGKRVVDSQPSIRTQDIEEVGDNRHTTFFEMLGNWSFGDYFKKEQLPWIWEFITEELHLPKEKLYVSVFEGNDAVPKDTESIEIWKSLGVPEDHIFEYGVKKNWWSRSGTPDAMPAGEIGGPDSEIFFDFGKELGLHEKSEWKDEVCHPNCDCGRFLEIGNSVFIQYKKKDDGTLEELPQKNVDFGGGLERMAAAVNNDPDVFKINVFDKPKKTLEESVLTHTKDRELSIRIILDHMRAAMFLVNSDVEPSNKQQGYVLRRIIRRAVVHAKSLNLDLEKLFAGEIIHQFTNAYPEGTFEKNNIADIVIREIEKFEKTLEKGLKEFDKMSSVDGKLAFDLFQTYGFPLELTLELAQEKGQQVDVEEFKKAFAEHQDKSRSASAGTFKGGLADQSEQTTALHTAHHLVLAALQQVVDPNITQKGSNITAERMRMDFNFDRKLTDEEVQQVEKVINEMIDKDLPVTKKVMSREEAEKIGAQMEFAKKYPDMVSVYFIGDKDHAFSKEFCGGPHVAKLSDLHGHVTITKQDSVSSGVRRLYAEIH